MFIRLFLFLFSFALLAENFPKVRVLYTKGKCFYEIGNKKRKKIQKNMNLRQGTRVLTGKDGRIVLAFGNHSKMRVDPSTNVLLEELYKPSKIDYDLTSKIYMKTGSIIYKINSKNHKGKVNVRTKYSAMGVRGTQFQTTIEEGNLWVGVKEGNVEINNLVNNKQADYISTGEGIVVDSKGSFSKPRKYKWVERSNWNTDPNLGSLKNNFRALSFSRKDEVKRLRKPWKVDKRRALKLKKIKENFKERRRNFINKRRKALGLKPLKDSLLKSKKIPRKEFNKRIKRDMEQVEKRTKKKIRKNKAKRLKKKKARKKYLKKKSKNRKRMKSVKKRRNGNQRMKKKKRIHRRKRNY